MPYFQRNAAPAPDPHIWDELQTSTDGLGGGMLDVTELDATKNGGRLIKGVPIFLDVADKKVHVVKSGLVITGGTTTAPRVDKKHLFKVSDTVYVSGDAVTINSIDTTNSAYDVFTLSAACTGASAGAILEQSAAAGATPAKKYVPNALLGNTVKIIAGTTVTCIVKINNWVNSLLIPHAVSSSSKTSLKPNITIV